MDLSSDIEVSIVQSNTLVIVSETIVFSHLRTRYIASP